MSTTVLPFTITIITIYYSAHNKHLKLEKNIFTIITIQYIVHTTKFQLFEFSVYTVWACLKGVTLYNSSKEESTNKNHCDDNYSAPFACRSFALYRLTSHVCAIFFAKYLLTFLANQFVTKKLHVQHSFWISRSTLRPKRILPLRLLEKQGFPNVRWKLRFDTRLVFH